MGDKKVNHRQVPLHTGQVERRVPPVAELVDVDAGIDQHPGGFKVTPMADTVQRVVSHGVGCVYAHELSASKIGSRCDLLQDKSNLVIPHCPTD